MKTLALALLLSVASRAATPRDDAKVAAGKPLGKREQLAGMTLDLQKTPSDDALRRRIIGLARSLKPYPALPEEAKRRMVRGAAAVKDAKDASDWKLAVAEFTAASLAAPWSGDIYYNLGVALDKASDYDGALRSLALAELASPDSEDAKNLRYAVEFRRDKANSPEALASKKKASDAEFLDKLDGAVFYDPQSTQVEAQYRIAGGRAQRWSRRLIANYCNCSDTAKCGGPVGEESRCEGVLEFNGRSGDYTWPDGAREVLDIAEDGRSARMRLLSPRIGVVEDKIYRRR